jgi:hypothetical protein
MAYGAEAIPTATSIASVAGSGTTIIVRVCPEKSSMKSYCVNGAMPVLRVVGAGFSCTSALSRPRHQADEPHERDDRRGPPAEFRRRIIQPPQARPARAMAHVEGSGTAAAISEAVIAVSKMATFCMRPFK